MRNEIQYMASLKNQLIVIFVFFIQSFFSQYFEFSWSNKTNYSNRKDGFYSGIISTNGQNMYVLNSNLAVSPLNKNSKLKLISYNKSTMTEIASVTLKGFPENEVESKELQTIEYYKTVVLESRIIVFWTKLINTDSTRTEELYAESFQLDLKRDKKIKKIYESVEKVEVQQSQFSNSSIVIASNKESNNVVIGSEINQIGSQLVFKYMILDNFLTSSNPNQINLPTAYIEEKNGLTSSYEYGLDRNIYIRTKYDLSRDELEKIKPNEPRSYFILTAINPLTKATISIDIKGADKTITDYSYLFTPEKTKIFGFFGDLAKDPTGIDKQGIFYTEIDNDTLVNNPLHYSYFEKTSLNKLFPKSKGGRKKITNIDLDAKEEELKTRFDIENIFLMEDSSVTLFFTRKYNYSEITSTSGLDGNNIYTTDLYCEKNNVSAIRINDKGKILWTSNLERSITYEGTDIADVKVIYKLNKFYVIYGSETIEEAKTDKKEKKTKFLDKIDYATFDPASGKPKKISLMVNEEGVEKKELKKINPRTITVFDDNFYFNDLTKKHKMGWYITNILCFPSIYYSVLSGNVKQASGYLGVLCLKEGKPIKKDKKKKK